MQLRPRPLNFPHGHGFAARTNRNCAGKVTFPMLRAIVIVPASKGWRSESKTPDGHSGASSMNKTP